MNELFCFEPELEEAGHLGQLLVLVDIMVASEEPVLVCVEVLLGTPALNNEYAVAALEGEADLGLHGPQAELALTLFIGELAQVIF